MLIQCTIGNYYCVLLNYSFEFRLYLLDLMHMYNVNELDDMFHVLF